MNWMFRLGIERTIEEYERIKRDNLDEKEIYGNGADRGVGYRFCVAGQLRYE